MSQQTSTVTPPVPDPDAEPKTADEMAAEGDRKGDVLKDGTRPDDEDEGHDPQFARNGE